MPKELLENCMAINTGEH